MKYIRIFYLKTFSFLVVKFSIYLNRHVFVMDTQSTCDIYWTGRVKRKHAFESAQPALVAESDARPTGDQEVGSILTGSAIILSCILIRKYFLRSFSPFR